MLIPKLMATVFAALILTGYAASAAIVAQKTPTSWNPAKPTHVIIASKGLSFAAVGYQQARVYENLFPGNQILFITNLPTTATYKYTKQIQLKKQGFSIVTEDSKILTSSSTIATILAHTKNIRTLDIISHNGVDKGPWLEDGDNRLDYKNEALISKLKPAFSANSWVRIQGCNSGWNVAPYLSQYLGVPVMGSFTSTSFYYLTTNGDYELFQSVEGGEPAKNLIPAKTDSWSFVTPQGAKVPTPCADGTCFTLIPEAAPYHYHVHKSPKAAWLPMSKPVCSKTISDERCQKAQAESIISAIGSTPRNDALTQFETYKTLVLQSVCGSYSSATSQKTCRANLEYSYNNRTEYFPYKLGEMLRCSGLRACSFTQESIDLRKNKNGTQSTVLEYLDNAFKGFQLLAGSLQ